MTQHYKTVETSSKVWFAILETHYTMSDSFVLYGTDSRPGRMFTSWGFRGATVPLMEAITTWNTEDRSDEKHAYYLCYPIEDNS
jgi:hypothetical protein